VTVTFLLAMQTPYRGMASAYVLWMPDDRLQQQGGADAWIASSWGQGGQAQWVTGNNAMKRSKER